MNLYYHMNYLNNLNHMVQMIHLNDLHVSNNVSFKSFVPCELLLTYEPFKSFVP
jgi:hypothetical protein